jgi:hypothetical protein
MFSSAFHSTWPATLARMPFVAKQRFVTILI